MAARWPCPAPDKIIDTIFVENAAQAHVNALQELQGAARCAGKAYFVTNNEPMPQGEIIRMLLAAIGINVKIRAVPVRLQKRPEPCAKQRGAPSG